MSEETKKLNLLKIFGQVQESYQEAEAKAKSEQGAPKVERFRTGEDGKYQIRVLPLAPVLGEDGEPLPMERKGYEWPLRQLFLDIEIGKNKNGKPKISNIPVIQATQKGVGHSVDLIDIYVKIAKEMYADDQEVLDLISKSSYYHGLKWNSLRCMYIIDLDHRNKGPQLYQPSYSQYRDMDDAKLDLWNDLLEDNDQQPCPISAFQGAYPVTINRKNNNGKTEYKFSIKTTKASSNYDLTEDELQKLFDMPRINDLIYRYTKYQAEATYVFLQQYDERHDLEVTKEQDFKDAYKTLLGELPKDDTSTFDLSKADRTPNGGEDKPASIEDLWARYDMIVDQDLASDSDEYQDLRADIAQFAKDNNLDLRISHSKDNKELLEELEDILDDQETAPANATKVKSDSKSESEPEPDKDEKGDPEPDPEPVQPAENSRRRTRRARPSDDDNDEASAPAVEPEPESQNNEAAEAPEDGAASEGRRRRRERRPR